VTAITEKQADLIYTYKGFLSMKTLLTIFEQGKQTMSKNAAVEFVGVSLIFLFLVLMSLVVG
jgi:hypothetical protein